VLYNYRAQNDLIITKKRATGNKVVWDVNYSSIKPSCWDDDLVDALWEVVKEIV
jgi:hypothetical protein